MEKDMRRPSKPIMKELGISIVYLFGSSVEGTVTPSSDIDVGIVFKKDKNTTDYGILYNEIYLEFSRIFKPSFKRGLDIVFLQQAPLSLQYSAIQRGQILYEEDPAQRVDYEERVINLYMDFKPVLEYFDVISSMRYTS